MFKRILIAIDMTQLREEVVETGAQIAKGCHAAAVGLLHVIRPLQGSLVVPVSEELDQEDARIDECKAQLQRMHRQFHSRALVEDIVVVGNPGTEILNTALAWKPDVIILGAHDGHGISVLIMGSTANAVARDAKCAVLIVRHREESARGRTKHARITIQRRARRHARRHRT